MAEIPPPNPSGSFSGVVNPPKKETGKVQPKKETVRINLPPKPTAAPTIKLPTLPPGGPTGAPTPAHMSVPAAAAPAHALRTAAAPVAQAAASAKPGAAPAAQRSALYQRQPAVPVIQTLDKVLIFAATVAALAAVGGATWILLTLNKLVEEFQM
jgi:hypothetical protein